MKRKIIGIVGAIALATLGTIALVTYVQSARDEAVASQRMVNVWVVDQLIAKGTPSAEIEDSVKQTKVPNNTLAEGGVTDLEELKGRVTNTALVPGEQVLASRFVKPTASRQSSIPEGFLQVTIKLDPERTLGGRVRAGDSVGVLLSLPKPVAPSERTHLELHKVRVTDVQAADDAPEASEASTETEKDAKKGKDEVAPATAGSLLVTLALDAPSVERVVYTAEFGTIWLSNEPASANEDGTEIRLWDNLYAKEAAR